MKNKKQVLVLYVGGTLGMEKNEKGVYVPIPNKFVQKLETISKLHHPASKKYFENIETNQLILPYKDNCILYELREYDPLLDSSNMSAKDWIKIGKDIAGNYNAFDGFVILHGTDTMVYTASVLSFMIEGLQKPVILTGAQISIFEKDSDATDNILFSLILSGCYNIPEVCIFFADKLLRGNRAVKVNATGLDAFHSPNYEPLATTKKTKITVNYNKIMKPSKASFKVNTNLNTNVGVLTFFPTITSSIVDCFLQNLSGVVIQSYGTGNIPSNQTELVDVLKKIANRGVLAVNTTICLQGLVSGIYETGKILEEIGIITGHDMTMEAALTKLCVVLGYPKLSREERVQLIKKNMQGELTPES